MEKQILLTFHHVILGRNSKQELWAILDPDTPSKNLAAFVVNMKVELLCYYTPRQVELLTHALTLKGDAWWKGFINPSAQLYVAHFPS